MLNGRIYYIIYSSSKELIKLSSVKKKKIIGTLARHFYSKKKKTQNFVILGKGITKKILLFFLTYLNFNDKVKLINIIITV